MRDEIRFYYQMALADDPDSVNTQQSIYEDRHDWQHAAAETAYIHAHNRLPDWAVFIQDFEEHDGSYIFIHRDPGLTN